MKKFIIVIIFCAIFSSILIAGSNSHPDDKNNGIGSNRFLNHYAGPIHPEHP